VDNGGDKTNGASYLHNYTVHYGDRIPLNMYSHTIQSINNVAYNTWAGSYIQTTSSAGTVQEPIAEYINNWLQHGPQGQNSTTPVVVLAAGFTNQPPTDQRARDSQIYLSGNYHNILRPSLTQPESDFIQRTDFGDPAHAVPLNIVTTRPTMMPLIASTVSAAQARQDVLNRNVGAYGTLPQGYDSIDARAVRALQNSSTGVFDTTSTATLCSDGECGETGVYTGGTPYVDSDGDGIPDSWEVSHSLNPNNPADGPALATNGYTNLENFLNELAGDTAAATGVTLPPQLLVHWRLDDAGGLSAADATGNGWTGTLTGSPTWLVGRVRGLPGTAPGALGMDGTTSYVTNPLLSWPANQPITVALWINTVGGVAAGAFNLGGSEQRAGAHIPWSDNVLYWDYGPSLLTGRLTVNFAPYLGQWTHVVLTANAANERAIWINGVRQATASAADAPTATLTGIELGRYAVYGQDTVYQTGSMDDFRLYTYLLSDAEIVQLYRETAGRIRHSAQGH
jgi:hypothetical protein